MSAPGCKKSSFSTWVIIYETNEKESLKTREEEKEVGARSSEPQKSEMNMIEHSQVEQYQQETEERVRQDLVEKWKKVNLFL